MSVTISDHLYSSVVTEAYREERQHKGMLYWASTVFRHLTVFGTLFNKVEEVVRNLTVEEGQEEHQQRGKKGRVPITRLM